MSFLFPKLFLTEGTQKEWLGDCSQALENNGGLTKLHPQKFFPNDKPSSPPLELNKTLLGVPRLNRFSGGGLPNQPTSALAMVWERKSSHLLCGRSPAEGDDRPLSPASQFSSSRQLRCFFLDQVQLGAGIQKGSSGQTMQQLHPCLLGFAGLFVCFHKTIFILVIFI